MTGSTEEYQSFAEPSSVSYIDDVFRNAICIDVLYLNTLWHSSDCRNEVYHFAYAISYDSAYYQTDYLLQRLLWWKNLPPLLILT